MNKYATRVHSWSEAKTHSCIYRTNDPAKKPVISGMVNEAAETLAILLNMAHEGSGPLLTLGALFTEFEVEYFGRNTYTPDALRAKIENVIDDGLDLLGPAQLVDALVEALS